jgi:tRNA pseudouridine55 synthase
MAEGVLPICVGAATRFAELLTAGEKQYIASFRLGQSFDTFDITGTLDEESIIVLTRDEIERFFQGLVGETYLTVPAFSAKKIDGKRAYDLARKGELKDAGSALMTIKRIELLNYDYPDGTFVVDCGKGTYVRSIIHELGQHTAAMAAMSGLIRSKNGSFHMDNALKLDQIAELVQAGKIEQVLTPVQDVLDLPKLVLRKEAISKLLNGMPPESDAFLPAPTLPMAAQCLILDESSTLLALGEFIGGHKPVKLSKVFHD